MSRLQPSGPDAHLAPHLRLRPKPNPELPQHHKVCAHCKELKSHQDFGKNKANKDGLYHICRQCRSELRKPEAQRKKTPEAIFKYQLKSKYGLTVEQRDAMSEAQGGTCAYPGCEETDEGRALQLDHDHLCCPGQRSCGRCVRMLLCGKHNSRLDRWERMAIDQQFCEWADEYVSAFRAPHGSTRRHAMVGMMVPRVPVFGAALVRRLSEKEEWARVIAARGRPA